MWDDYYKISRLFDKFDDAHPQDDITIVSGGCPLGADFICEQEARRRNWTVEVHPANWARYGKRAGMVRNQEMVDLGADLCWAFWDGESRGTQHCANAATMAGIETEWILLND